MEMDLLIFYAQSFVLSIFGGILFSASIEKLLPPYRLGARKSIISSLALAALFWSCWMLPQAILLATTGRPLFVMVVLTIMFSAFLLGSYVGTLALSRIKRDRGSN